ncbi:hypothetical protein [Polaromonas sp. CG_9.11]|uniref:hypothetical protein n=1 Tax=Polaromonas sp. CG_9.11 TaxID=2787730 RepID=UPI0018C8D925|nr:hypothetical protein [Polaromonas sp. CG_9.11]MBG6075572.1 hypothetical protein [Polaromonas sp. CG_9.11]
MTRFINTPHPDHHHGADRMEALMDAVQHVPRDVLGKRGAALLLGSALAAAVAAVAYEVMDSAAESHLLMIWMALWIALFAVLALFADTLRAAGQQVKSSLDGWSRGFAEARADQRLWAIARQDGRVMADLQSAMSRSEAVQDAMAPAAVGEPAVKPTALMSRPHARYHI